MDKKEFTKLFKELQKIQLSLLYSTKLSSNLYANYNLNNNTSYINMCLFVLDINRNIDETHSYHLYSNDSIDKNKAVVNEIKQKVKQFTTPLRGNKAKRSGASDTPIK